MTPRGPLPGATRYGKGRAGAWRARAHLPARPHRRAHLPTRPHRRRPAPARHRAPERHPAPAPSPRQIACHQRRPRHRARHEEDRDQRHQEAERQRDPEAEGEQAAALQQGQPLPELHTAALQRHRRQLLGQEEAGDTEADRRDDGLADHREETRGEEQEAVERHPHQDADAVARGDPQFAPEREAGSGDIGTLRRVDPLGERLVEGLADQQGHGRERDDGEQQGQRPEQYGQKAPEECRPGRAPGVGERCRPGDGVIRPERERDQRGRIQDERDQPRQQPESVLPAAPADPALALHQISETRPEITHAPQPIGGRGGRVPQRPAPLRQAGTDLLAQAH